MIISHGYPGNRYLMSHLGENLASKGFVVVSIDHKDSTYDDQKAFASTLYNRPFDQLFVLNEMERLGKAGSGSFLSGRLDASRTGIVGYSMGGYGVVNVVGGGYSKASETIAGAPPNKLLAERGAANPEYRKTIDPRIKAAIAIAPWGMVGGFWDAEGLKGISTPMLFVAGSVDDVAGYEKGTKAIYQGAVNADRYLLTFVNANHNAGAPIPAPAETYTAPGSRPARGLRALRRCGVGHGAHEQHPRSLRDRVLRSVSEGRRSQAGVFRTRVEGIQARDRRRPDARAFPPRKIGRAPLVADRLRVDRSPDVFRDWLRARHSEVRR